MSQKRNINVITGSSGQDGYFLAKLLNSSGEVVHAMENSQYKQSRNRFGELRLQNPFVHEFHFVDFEDDEHILKFIRNVKPNVIYNFAGFSSVAGSFQNPQGCLNINLVWFEQLLRSVQKSNEPIKVFQCSSSEMYSASIDGINECTKLSPLSPYGLSKAASHLLAGTFREIFGLDIRTGILFNHESERRPDSFVFKSIIKQAVKCRLGISDHIVVQNLDTERDWGFAGDYVEAMKLIMERGDNTDYVIATGTKRSVKQVILRTLDILKIRREITDIVRIDTKKIRTNDHPGSAGDARKLFNDCAWSPRLSFEDLVERMVVHELAKY